MPLALAASLLMLLAPDTARPRPRRTRVPPALTRGAETLPGSPVLDEIPGALGVLLWRSARNARLWAGTPDARRGRLFDPTAAAEREGDVRGAGPEPELLAPLSVFVRLLEAPALMDAARVVNACRRIAHWAERRGALGTALEFAQAAALAAPHVAALAYAVGRLARRRAEYDRAESWLARAVVQARRTGDWRTYALAYSGLGNLNVQKGNFPLARRAHERCLRTAVRHGLRDLEGSASHDLFATALESGTETDVDGLAERALLAYGPCHPNVPRLAFDLAYRWIVEGYFGDALRVALALVPHFESPCDRGLALSLVARSAGGARDDRAFHQAREGIDALNASGAIEDAAARVLLGVAHGAASLGEWELAARYGGEALGSAQGRREGRLLLETESLLESVRTRAAAVPNVPAVEPTRLADEFVAALRGERVGGLLVA